MTNHVISYVELGYSGHQALHLRATAEAFLRSSPESMLLSCWLSLKLLEDDPALKDDFGALGIGDRIRLHFLEDSGASGINSSPGRLQTALNCIQYDGASACYLPYLDSCMLEIATLRPGRLQAKLSGTLFRPTLHYHTFEYHRGQSWPPGRKSWLYNYLLTILVARRRFISEILTLDPFAPFYYDRLTATSKFRYLPDYVQREDSPILRADLGLPADRTVFLLAGGISNYKGVRELLEGVRLACVECEAFRDRAAVVLAGRILESHDLIYDRVAELASRYPELCIQIFDRRLTEREFFSFVAAADVICLPYIEFAGMSSLLLHAAAYEHPVIGPEYGLLGELIRRYHLGVVCRPTAVETLKDALCSFVSSSVNGRAFGSEGMRLFAAGHSVDSFGQEICDAMLRAACHR